jgi:hypothetical protein
MQAETSLNAIAAKVALIEPSNQRLTPHELARIEEGSASMDESYFLL